MKKPEKPVSSVGDEASAVTDAPMVVDPAIATAWVGVFAEGTRFLAHRMRQDLDTQKAILACKNPAELLEIQARFFETAVEEYSEEVMRFTGMVVRAAEETAEDAVASHSLDNDDVPV